MKFAVSIFLHALALPASLTWAFSFQSPTALGRVDTSEGAQRDVYTMADWAQQYGVQQAEGFEITSYDGQDFFAATQADQAAGTPLLYVPNELIFSATNIEQEFGSALQQAEYELANGKCVDKIPLFRIFIKILVEYEKGEESPWYPWLNAMPRIFYNGAAMTFACFDVLPPYAAWLAMTERINAVNFQKAARMVPILSDETKNDKDILKWAYCVATTRAMELNGEKIVAPMADMFNHGTETEVEIQLDEGGNVIVYATQDVPAGSPLRMSLGDPTNPSPLFARYGFLDDSSPATFCKTMQLRDEMEALGYDFSNLLFFKDTGDISMEVYDVFLYSILLQNDPESAQGFYNAVMSGDEDTKGQYHEHFFPYTLEAMKKHVDDTLKELDDLSSKAQTYDPATHPRVPVILAHNSFVKETFLRVKQNLENM